MALTKTWAGRKTGLVILRIDSLHELKIPAPDTRPIMFHINLVVITYSCRKWPKIKMDYPRPQHCREGGKGAIVDLW